MPNRDLRDFIDQIDGINELIRLDGVDWNEEVGAVYAISSKAVLMDNFPGYPSGYRILVRTADGLKRFFLAANWNTEARGVDLTRAWLEHQRQFKPIPPKWVKDGPVLENVYTGQDVDVLKFPVPKWHEDDGGRYIGTAGIEIVKDPDTGRLNFGTYRMQVHDKANLGIHMSDGKDGHTIREKYLQAGKPCPIVAVFGTDPAYLIAGGARMTHVDGSSELDFTGWLKGSPEEVIEGRFTGLPVPANAEIVVEGEIVPGVTQLEGPFGESTGYSHPRQLPTVKIKAVYHRNNPILTGTMPLYYPPGRSDIQENFQASALIWDQMERAGVREIKGVASFFGFRLTVVSIKNSFAGHSRQAGLIASQCHTGNYQGNWVIVVDDDIDPTVLNDVLWRVVTRIDARRAIQVLDYLWSSNMALIDPSRAFINAEWPLTPNRATYRSGAVIDACIPVEWDHRWHRAVKPSRQLTDRVMQKWGDILKNAGRGSPNP